MSVAEYIPRTFAEDGDVDLPDVDERVAGAPVVWNAILEKLVLAAAAAVVEDDPLLLEHLNPTRAPYNVDKTGAASAVAGVQAAVNDAAARGIPVVYLPAGDYKWDGTVTLPASGKVRIVGAGAASILNASSVTTSLTMIRVAGSYGAAVPLTIDAEEGDTTLAIADTSSFADGSVAKVYATRTAGFRGQPGEIVTVRSAATMTLEAPLADTYATANTASVQPLTQVPDVGVYDLKFLGPADTSLTIIGISFEVCRRPRVIRCVFERTHEAAHQFIDCSSPVIYGCQWDDFGKPTAYGVYLRNATHDTVVAACIGSRMRHLVTHSGTTSLWGYCRRTTVVGCIGTQLRDAGFDCHPPGEDVWFIGCHVSGSERDGITHQGESGGVANCTVRNCALRGILVQTGTVKRGGLFVGGNFVASCPQGILVLPEDWQGATAPAGATPYGPGSVVLGLNTVDGSVTTAIQIDGARSIGASPQWRKTIVLGNVVTNCGGEALYLANLDGVVVKGNAAHCTPDEVIALRLLGVTNAVVSGNELELDSAVGTTGIHATLTGDAVPAVCSGLLVGGNRIRGADVAIRADDSTSDSSFSGNNWVGCVRVVAGAGAGNLWASNNPRVSAEAWLDVDYIVSFALMGG